MHCEHAVVPLSGVSPASVTDLVNIPEAPVELVPQIMRFEKSNNQNCEQPFKSTNITLFKSSYTSESDLSIFGTSNNSNCGKTKCGSHNSEKHSFAQDVEVINGSGRPEKDTVEQVLQETDWECFTISTPGASLDSIESELVKSNEKDEELVQLFYRRNIGSLQKSSKPIAILCSTFAMRYNQINELFEQSMHRTDLITKDGKSEHEHEYRAF